MKRTMNRGALALVATIAMAASLGAQTVAITGGKVYPVSGPPIEGGTVLMRDGKIVAVGKDVAIPGDAQRVDATGKWVTPGLINANTSLGFGDVGFSGGPREQQAKGHDGIAAGFQVWLGFNTQSVMIAPAREGGVTSVVAAPTGGLVSGQAAIVDLNGALALTDLLVKAPATMIAQIEDNDGAKVGAAGELIGQLRDLIEDTKAYMRRKSDFERAQTRPFVATRRDLEAMIPVVEGREPLTIIADQAAEIREALNIAKDYGIKVVIAGGAEAWTMADKLAAAKVPVLTGAENNIPGSFSTLGEPSGKRRDAPEGGRAGGAHRQRRRRRRAVQHPQSPLRGRQRGCVRHEVGRRAPLDHAGACGDLRGVGQGRIAQARLRRKRGGLERRSIRVLVARGAGVRAREEDRCPVAAGHAREAVSDAAAEVQHALRLS